MSSRKQTQEQIKDLESKIKQLKTQMKEYDDADIDDVTSEDVVFCSKCGTKNPADAAFCSKCGAKLG
jgi:sec-independent protein translocase protein TatA